MLQVGKLREGEKSKANNVLFKCMRKKSLCGHPRPVILQSVTWELLFFTETIWDFSQATVKKMTIQDFFSAFCLSTSAVSLCIAYLCGVFAWGMRPCVKEQTGGEEKLPSEFNLRWGTKYSLLLIPRSDIGRYKKKKLFTFSVIFICLRSYHISSTGNTFEFLQLLSSFYCPGSVPSANCNLVAEFRPIYSILYCNCIQRLTSFFATK